MGVYIKGMKMPKNCCDCPCYQDAYDFYPYCMAIEEQRIVGGGHLEKDGKGRHKDCPLVEVPEPHGDLIDRQKLLEDNKHLEYPTNGKYRRDRAWAVGFNSGARHCNEHAVYAKPVIEAEGEE